MEKIIKLLTSWALDWLLKRYKKRCGHEIMWETCTPQRLERLQEDYIMADTRVTDLKITLDLN